MSIVAYTGLPGHGKSYGVVENLIVPALKNKRTVFTNIPMNGEVIKNAYKMDVHQFDLKDIEENPNWWKEEFIAGSLIVIDEVWRLWPSGLKTNNARIEDKEFLAEHRHMVGENGQSTEIALVTQDLSQLASFVKTLVENTFHVVKLTSLGLSKNFRVDVYQGAVTGSSPPKSKRIRQIQGRFKKEIYKLYVSHTKSATGEAGDETRVDSRFNVLKGIGIKMGIVVIILAIVFTYYGLKELASFYGMDGEVEDAKPESSHSIPNSRSESPSTVKVKAIKEPAIRFLSKAESVVIYFSSGIFPDVDLRYKVEYEKSSAVLTTKELRSLSYDITIVNECTARIVGEDYDSFVMCEREEKKKTWVEGLVTQNDS